jgi:hypothetical protein
MGKGDPGPRSELAAPNLAELEVAKRNQVSDKEPP